MIIPGVFGLVGVAILLGLGIWQVQRLQWKRGVLAEIEARITADPVPLPADPDPRDDRYLPVTAEGRFGNGRLDVLASTRGEGPGFRVVQPFELADGRLILVDRGFVPEAARDAIATPDGVVRLVGNLHWPDDSDAFTPAPDLARSLVFARQVPVLAEALGTEPILLILREALAEGWPEPQPVGTEGIPNDHLNYAITWFSLALLWAGMTAYLLWRIRRRTV